MPWPPRPAVLSFAAMAFAWAAIALAPEGLPPDKLVAWRGGKTALSPVLRRETTCGVDLRLRLLDREVLLREEAVACHWHTARDAPLLALLQQLLLQLQHGVEHLLV
jgi:hypothetical protein